MGAIVYEEPLVRRYTADRCSCAYLFWLLCLISIVVAPFFIALESHGFWKKTGRYQEQPHTFFQHKVLMQLEGREPGSARLFSTVREVNDLVGYGLVRVPSVKAASIDHNFDGITDEYLVNVSVPLKAGERVHRCQLLVAFDYVLNDRVRLQMDGLAVVQAESVAPGRHLLVQGRLQLEQRDPLPTTGGDRLVYRGTVLNADDLGGAENVTVPAVLSRYFAQNETVRLYAPDTYWTAGATDRFEVSMRIRVDDQSVHYIPPSVEVLKFAWVQYLATLAVFWWLADQARGFVFKNQLFDTRVQNMGVPLKKLHQF